MSLISPSRSLTEQCPLCDDDVTEDPLEQGSRLGAVKIRFTCRPACGGLS